MALFIGFLLTGCDDESQAQIPNNPESSISPTPVYIPEINKEVKDSLDKYTARIDSISRETEEAIKKVESMQRDVLYLKKEISALKDNEKWWWTSCGIGIVAIILAIVCLIRYAELNRRLNRHRNDIQGLQRDKQSESFPPRAVSRNVGSSDIDTLKRRVEVLERQMGQQTSTPRYSQHNVERVVNLSVHEANKNGYFGNPVNATEPYFKKLLGSRDSDARFIAEVSGNEAKFQPLDSSSYLGTFVSNDAMRAAVDFKGCSPSAASSMRICGPGKAILRDNKWIIIKKATVILS